MRRLFLVAGLLASACGPTMPPMQVGQECPMGDTTLQLEAGPVRAGGATACQDTATALVALRNAFEARFGPQDLRGMVVRLRAAQDLRQTGLDVDFAVGGWTYQGQGIDLASEQLVSYPHELNHVRKGSGHGGWCVDYEPWSEEVLNVNQRGYLGCQ